MVILMDRNKIIKYIVYLIPLVILGLELTRDVIYLGNPSFEGLWNLQFASSICLAISAVFIFFLVDRTEFSTTIVNTNIDPDSTLNPSRFLYFMPLAMITCFFADFVLHNFEFIFGMLTFLIGHIFYIIAYSGIINIKSVFKGKSKNFALISTILTVIGSIIMYLILVYNPEELLTIIVIPYVMIISFMVLMTFYSLSYKRSVLFRIFLCGGSILFYFSDLILATNMFKYPIPYETIIVIITYLLGNGMLQYAVLFLKK
jgi:uncharacterized membrane protein YhhN